MAKMQLIVMRNGLPKQQLKKATAPELSKCRKCAAALIVSSLKLHSIGNSEYSCTGRFPCLRLGADTVFASHHVRVQGVVISSDLSLEKHASNVSATGFHHLRQLRRTRRSVNRDSAATLVHAFVTSRVDSLL